MLEENKKVKEQKNKKKIIGSLLIITLLLIITGVTYAAFEYNFQGNKNVISTGTVSIEFLESTDVISLSNALPISDKEGKEQIDTFDFSVTTKANGEVDLRYNLMIEKLTVDTGYTSFNDDEIKVYLTDYNNNVLVEPSLISDLNSTLYSKTNTHSKTLTEIKDKYKLRVWIDKDVLVENWDTIHYQYKFKIGVNTKTIANQCNEVSVVSSGDTSNANAPVLSENMIPVYYDTCEEVWKKADSTNQSSKYGWYDYDNKIWANSVTVSSTNREAYKSANPGTTIPMDDILTMQVWIPRYKYKVWNYNLSGKITSEPQEIEITFEEGTAKTGDITCTDNVQGTSDGTKNGTQPTTSEICKINNIECTDELCNNKTYTHPAFTFGDKELIGIWIGKFELSSDKNCTPEYYSGIDEDCNLTNINPRVKPNATSWRGAMVSVFENNIMKMNNDDNAYGFANTDDTHMIKNIEWGAVAYLSHSKYGINKEIAVNSYSSYKTGCGPQKESSTSYGRICNAYNTSLGQTSSTTGNIYGIYDMSGGADEYVMGNMISPDGEQMMSGNRANTSDPNDHSGYDGILYYDGETSAGYGTYDGIYSYPDNKYIDKYSFNTSDTTRSRSKLGDGIREVYNKSFYGWYSDHSYLASSIDPWFIRGYNYYNGINNAGVFNSRNNNGIAGTGYSSRLVISQ